jgi:energy-coupling factor transport system permease protein
LKDTFSTFHPVVNFIYFLAVIAFSMFFMHPVFLGISLVCSMIYSIYLNGGKAVRFNLLYMLPTLLFFAVMNPVFNHAGATILVYVNDNPITLESILYGFASATMFISVIIWFSCYNAVMTSDKFIYLFGRVIPAMSLILSMVLRLVPKFKAQIHVISNAQKCVGRDVSNGNVFQKARNGMKIISILTTWALENAIETADSMKSRGYGLKGRTSFSNFRFDTRDRTTLAILIVLIAFLLFGALAGENNIVYFPAVWIKPVSLLSVLIYFAYGALCLLPMAFNLWEDIKWARLKSKI